MTFNEYTQLHSPTTTLPQYTQLPNTPSFPTFGWTKYIVSSNTYAKSQTKHIAAICSPGQHFNLSLLYTVDMLHAF